MMRRSLKRGSLTALVVVLAAAGAVAVATASASGSAAPGAGLALTGIVGGPFKVAIIEDEGGVHIVRVGDRIGAASVVGIGTDRVVLKQGRSVFTLGLARISRVNSVATNGTATGAAPASIPSTAQPVSAPSPPAAPAPVPAESTVGAPSPGQGAPAYPLPSQAPTVLLVNPSNTSQPSTVLVVPSTTAQPTTQPIVLVAPPNTGLTLAQPVVLLLSSNPPQTAFPQTTFPPSLYVVPSFTSQPSIPPVMPFGSTVYTPGLFTPYPVGVPSVPPVP